MHMTLGASTHVHASEHVSVWRPVSVDVGECECACVWAVVAEARLGEQQGKPAESQARGATGRGGVGQMGRWCHMGVEGEQQGRAWPPPWAVLTVHCTAPPSHSP